MDLSMSKSSSHFNELLIQLQEQYAIRYLTHVNRYTGLRLRKIPAVMTIRYAMRIRYFFDSKLPESIPAVQL
jgi:hypothetical protein